MASDHAMLVQLSETIGDSGRTRWVLDRPSMVIGRHSACEILLPDRQISRQHARVSRRDDIFVIEDLGSKNGTYVNGEPAMGSVILEDGDLVQLGLAYRFIFVDAEATAPLIFDAAQAFMLRVDEEKKQVWIGGQPLEPPLSPAQFEVLRLLVAADGGIVPREAIVEAVWGADAIEGVTEQAIDALVRRLRRRLAEVAPEQEFIVTVRGHGFRLEK
ncbi:MAG: FHA domain-containing protein [Ardenticatenaceae bacterium]|nr:FHA domain-containing protein [Ardenticatenaceae bacterium]HBY95688.1 hypothetical protein [Chloroflexota bacterium]